MHRILCLALLSCAAGPAQETLTTEKLLAAYVTGLGGVEKLRAVNTVVMKGTLDNPEDGSKVPVEIHAKAPNLYARITRFDETAISRIVFAGDAGWNQDPDNGVQPMSKIDIANGRLDYDLHRAVRLAEFYPKMSTPKRAKLGDKEAWSIEASTSGGAEEAWWFDPTTSLLLCREYERVTMEDGIIHVREYYSDYREFEGLKFPATVRQVLSDYEMLYHFNDVKVNPPVEDSVFTKPR